jgi:GNAT superfamily N-acetyltransferase
MILRPYDPVRDLAPCLAIWRRASEAGHPFLDSATLDADGEIVRTQYMPAAEITVAEAADRAAGFIALLGGIVGGLFVDPAHHGRGIGRALIVDAARRKGPLDVEVYEANAGARAFYRALGFVETGRRETDDMGRALPLIAMRRGG